MERVKLFGMDFVSADSVTEIADSIIDDLSAPEVRYDTLITPNAYITVQLNESRNKWIKEFFSRSRYILPDGTPIVWLSRLKGGGRLKSRLTGSDLFPQLWSRLKERHIPVTMVLANEEISHKFREEYRLCNYLVPAFFDVNDDAYVTDFAGKVVDKVIEGGSRFVFLGVTTPKQEKLAYHIVRLLTERKYDKGVLILLLGASYEFYFGTKQRAPSFIQKSGFEWLYRLAKEPRRLWKRYTVDNVRFITLAIKELVKG
jgi:N-acetylglucosaminyldiphosphoundecaprenol N-acetyl-beta-D-mannosaminyltransferase